MEKKKVKRKVSAEVKKSKPVKSYDETRSSEKNNENRRQEEFGLGFVYDIDIDDREEDIKKENDTERKKAGKSHETKMNFAAVEDNIDEAAKEDASIRAKKRISKKTSKWRKFWIGLSIYAGILAILFIVFMIYTNKSLSKYESSQSIYAMQKYFEKFAAGISAGTLPEEVVLPDGVSAEEYISYVKGKLLSYDKAPNSYSSEKPVYVIKADGEEVLRVNYEGYNENVIFAILTVLDWKLVGVKATYKDSVAVESTTEPEPTTEPTETETETTTEEETTTEAPTYTYTIKAPSLFTVYIDGEELSIDDYVTNREEHDNLMYANRYLMVADMVTYTVPGVREGAKVTMKDQNGKDVENINKDKKKKNTYSANFAVYDEVPEAYKDVALTIAQNWSLFMTRDLTGEAYGFNHIAQYLINGSDYYRRAYEWATGVDITFTSPHTLGDPIFTNVVVDEFTLYAERCFSVHISFSKDMYLTLTGGTANDNTDATFVFLYYDDSDDGVDNARWTLIDMISR